MTRWRALHELPARIEPVDGILAVRATADDDSIRPLESRGHHIESGDPSHAPGLLAAGRGLAAGSASGTCGGYSAQRAGEEKPERSGLRYGGRSDKPIRYR